MMEHVEPPVIEEPTSTIAISGLVIVLAIIFTVLRFYVRISTKTSLGWDDFLILVSVFATLATAILVLVASAKNPHGTWIAEARDPSYVFEDIDILYVKLTFVASVTYFQVAGSAKMSILLMYNRIFSVSPSFRRQLYVASFIVMGWWIGCTVATLTNCIPLKYTWINGLADPRYCINFNVFWMASGAVEVVVDAIVLSLPIQVILKMHFSWKKKVTVATIFLLGGFVLVTGLIRTILGFAPDGRREPQYSKVEVWTLVHSSLAIVCACLPVLMPLVYTMRRVIVSPAKRYINSWFGAGRTSPEVNTVEKLSSANTEALSSTRSPETDSHRWTSTGLPVDAESGYVGDTNTREPSSRV